MEGCRRAAGPHSDSDDSCTQSPQSNDQGSENELSRLEEQLRRPDFVLEPSAWETVRQYLRSGGKPDDSLEMLTEGYVGKDFAVAADAGLDAKRAKAEHANSLGTR